MPAEVPRPHPASRVPAEHARQCQQQEHGNPQRPGVHRERQDRSQAKQPASGGGPGQLVADDLPRDHAGVGPVKVG
jgi:hypothetical protein